MVQHVLDKDLPFAEAVRMGAMIEPPLVPRWALLDEVSGSAAISMRSSNTIFTRARLTCRCPSPSAPRPISARAAARHRFRRGQ